MNVAGIDFESVSDGEGVRVVLYLTSCSHNCHMCHNSETHDPKYGVLYAQEIKNQINDALKVPYISGISLSGGDPLHENNLSEVLNLVKEIRLSFGHNKTIWLYSGYCWEQCFPSVTPDYLDEDLIMRQKVIEHCDVMVDGRYMHELRDITLPYRGSSNQRLIDVKRSLNERGIIDWISK